MKNNQTLKIKRPSYVIAETSKAQKSVLNILTDMGYRWANKIKANEFIPIEENKRMDVINIYPSNLLLTMSPQDYGTDEEEITYDELLKQSKKVIL